MFIDSLMPAFFGKLEPQPEIRKSEVTGGRHDGRRAWWAEKRGVARDFPNWDWLAGGESRDVAVRCFRSMDLTPIGAAQGPPLAYLGCR